MPTQMQTIWEGLETRQRLVAIMTAVAIIATVFGIGRVVTAPTMAILYSGLDPAASGEVVSDLEAGGVPFEIRGNTVLVESSQRDRLRMEFASKGLPAGGPAGYELLDGLSGFGTTSQMFDAAYWRAKEGELARTIAGGPNVRSARVHLANPVSQPFSRESTGSASVTVTMARGSLAGSEAEAIRYLVSSAVAGIEPESVAVIDSAVGVVLSGADDELTRSGVRKPDEHAEQLRQNIQRLLEARVGAGRAIVEVNVDANMDSQTISERLIDPQSRVAISSEIEENKEEATGTASGVTVASNLPDGDVQGGGGENNRSSSQVRERQNFEVSETRTERVILPGQVERINVAVMVDGLTSVNDAGEITWEPRPEAEMETLRQLVQTAAGINAERGDTITIESLQFMALPDEGTLVEAGKVSFVDRYGAQLVQGGVLGGIILALIFFVLRPLMKSQNITELSELPELEALQGTDEPAEPKAVTDDAFDVLDLPQTSAVKIDRLREVISSRSEDSAAVLRGWIEAPDGQKEPVM